MKTRIILIGFLGYLLTHTPIYAKVSATLDREQTNLDGPVQLTITSDQEQAEQMDTHVLEQDFSIVGRSSSTQISMRNGSVTKESRIILSLLPKREGILEIPPLTVGQDQTTALQVVVEATPDSVRTQPGDTQPGVIIETEWEHSGAAYVQGQINLIIRIYHQGNLLEASLDEPRPANTLMLRLGNDLQGASSRNGQQYQTIERRYALFPQQSGTLEVPPVALQVRIPDTDRAQQNRFGLSSFNRGKQLTLKSKPLSIDVLPPAPEFSGAVWLPSQSINLHRSGIPDEPIRIGDAINMRIDLTAQGLTGKQLPEVKLTDPQARFNIYPDQPEFNSSADGTWVNGQRNQTFVVIPTQAGIIQLPSVQLKWWDRQNNGEQTAELPALSIEVLAADTGQSPSKGKLPDSSHEIVPIPGSETALIEAGDIQSGVDPLWKWISLISLAGWTLSIAYFIFYSPSRRAQTGSPTPQSGKARLRSALRAIESAARANDAERSWLALKDYAHIRWPENPPATPESWAARLGNSEARIILEQLDACLFRSQAVSNWNGKQLATSLIPLLKSTVTSPADAAKPGVAELYPPATPTGK